MRPRTLLVPLVAFVIALAAFGALARSGGPATPAAAAGTVPVLRTSAPAQEQLAALEARVRQAPGDPARLTALGGALLQRARETEEARFTDRAEDVFERALRADPADAGALAGLGAIAMGRHDFAAALRLAERARRAAPEAIAPEPVLVELGRTEDAEVALQRFVDRRPSLPSYAHVSYLRELRGDLDGAVAAMRLALSAGGGPEAVAAVLSLVGDLEGQRGRPEAARRAYEEALQRRPRHPDAELGLASLDAGEGRLAAAIDRQRRVAAAIPAPDHLIALAETELAAGRTAAARAHLREAFVQEAQVLADGGKPDAGLVVLQADHGDPAEAVRTGRAVWAAAPSTTSADALGWALIRAGRPEEGRRWARRALAGGWRDPAALLHAGVAAVEAGDRREGRRLLRRALRAGLSVHGERVARRALSA